jgi:hypothetical protein
MIKSYLNNGEKNEFCILISFKVFLEECVDKWSKRRGVSKLQLKWAKMSLAFANKIIQEILLPLEDDVREKLAKVGKQNKVVVKTKEEALRDLNRAKENGDVMLVKNEDLLELCSAAMLTCTMCKVKEHNLCATKRLLREYDVDPLVAEPYPGQCEYQVSEFSPESNYDLIKSIYTEQLFRVRERYLPDGFELVESAPLGEQYWKLPKITF